MNQSTGWVEHSLGRSMARLDISTYPEWLILAAAPGFPSEFRLARPQELVRRWPVPSNRSPAAGAPTGPFHGISRCNGATLRRSDYVHSPIRAVRLFRSRICAASCAAGCCEAG
jgi:hypothetical protein